MKLVIFGPPGSGKGTYSTKIANFLNLKRIATGDIFREIAKNDENIREIIKRGELVKDEIVNEIVEKEISNLEGKRGFILDGYPRTVEQAKFLDNIAKLDALILIKVSREILIEKTLARRNCKNCGFPWNVAEIDKVVDGVHYYLPKFLPSSENCEVCGQKLELVKREDDTYETISKRIEIYENQTEPVLNYYRNNIPFIEVWMNRPAQEIVEKILRELENLGIK